MIAIDTNVLVRIIVEDTGQPEQTKIARQLIQNAKKVYITQVVQIEFTWVLAKIYKIDKIRLISVLEHLLNNPDYVLQNQSSFETALNLFKQSQADFSDCLILAESCDVKSTLHTFDKKLAKHSNTKLIG